MTTLATQIRNAMFVRLTTSAFTWKSTRKIPVPPIQPNQLPALGVYLIRESMGPDGDANVGPPRYIVDAVFSVNVLEEASNPDVLEGSMDALVDQVENTLLSDISFLNLSDSNGDTIIDSIPAITRNYDFPKDGETQYIQCRLQFTVRFFVIFPPIITHDLITFGLTVRPPNMTAGDTNNPYPDDFDEEFPLNGAVPVEDLDFSNAYNSQYLPV